MTKVSRTELKKLEDLYKSIGYTVRYEKGSFQSGYCLLEDHPIVVINKFFDRDGRYHTLLAILAGLDLPRDTFSDETLSTLDKYLKRSSSLLEPTPE